MTLQAQHSPRTRIEWPCDIQAQPGYIETVDPKTVRLVRILDHYHLKQEFPCGIKSCRQLHKEGVLIALEGGRCTNVGHICGKQYWDKFEEMSWQYADAVVRPRLISAVADFRQLALALTPDLTQLKAPAEAISGRKIELRRQFPTLFRALEQRAAQNDRRVTESVRRSAKEVEDIEALQGAQAARRMQFKEVEVGVLTGLSIFKESVREVVITRLLTPFQEIQTLELASLSTKDLLRWDNWISSFKEIRRTAEAALREGEAFFSEANFQLCKSLALTPLEKARLQTLSVRNLDSGRSSGGRGGAEATHSDAAMTHTSAKVARRLHLLMRNLGRIEEKKE